jgi:phthiocerol/phenolphthiocerol synthesis type-I polyketide synthase D
MYGAPPVGALDDFGSVGGRPSDLQRVAAALTERLGHPVDVGDLHMSQTVQELAERLRVHVEAPPGMRLRHLRPHGSRPPLFLFHPAGGPTSVYRGLVRLLGEDQPCYGLERLEDVPEIPDKAARYVEIIRQVHPAGPYRLVGWSFGSYLAYEVATQMADVGDSVDAVALIDAVLPLPTDETAQERLLRRLAAFTEYVAETYRRPLRLPYADLERLVGREQDQIDLIIGALAAADVGLTPAILRHQRDSLTDLCCLERYQPKPCDRPIVLYRTAEDTPFNVREPRFLRTDPAGGWERLCPDLTVVPLTGHHLNVLDPPHVEPLAEHLIRYLRQVGSQA